MANLFASDYKCPFDKLRAIALRKTSPNDIISKMSKERLLIATHNPAKLERYRRLLSDLQGIETVSFEELDVDLKVEETEPTALGNAVKKATEYAKAVNLPVLAVDEELFIDALPPEKQPGVNVRRIAGHEATDEELLQAVLGLLEGLPLEKRGYAWNFAIALATPEGKVDTREVEFRGYFALEPKLPIRPGYPLSSLFYDPKLGKYHSEQTQKEELERLVGVKKAVEELILSIENLSPGGAG
jgi:XTP/dITP diphosphohydrolase